ncbi:MAG: VanZ family protein [Nanoarchaeota archaeon]|nr:VanZ family protein [Nanoarchaeota archaeon]
MEKISKSMKHWRIFSFVVAIFVAVLIFAMSSISLSAETGNYFVNIKALGYHLGIFFFLAFFLIFAIAPRTRKGFLFLVLLLLSYGVLDEFHQFFVPGRAMTFFDIWVDFIGILFGAVFWLGWQDWQKEE